MHGKLKSSSLKGMDKRHIRVTQATSLLSCALSIIIILGVHFWGTVKKGPAECFEECFSLDDFGKTEVGQFDSKWIEGRDQDIVRFDIAVGYLSFMKILQCVQKLSGDTLDHVFGNFAVALEVCRKFATSNILHNDVDPSVVLVVVHILNNIGLRTIRSCVNMI
jgi:hypothetical protein